MFVRVFEIYFFIIPLLIWVLKYGGMKYQLTKAVYWVIMVLLVNIEPCIVNTLCIFILLYVMCLDCFGIKFETSCNILVTAIYICVGVTYWRDG